MSTYLDLAEKVLRDARKPLTAIQMLRLMYAMELAPPHLHGRTQQKTLQARLSEDILRNRDRSRFYRTAPGKFFLRAFIDDPSIPEKDRRPIIARRRRRDLPAMRPLAIIGSVLKKLKPTDDKLSADLVLNALEQGSFRYPYSIKHVAPDEVAMWAVVLVIKSSCVLSYRSGRYREDRDTFAEKRSIGFYSPVREEDLTLFDRYQFGIVESGLRALMLDLDVHDDRLARVIHENTDLKSFIRPSDIDSENALLAVVAFECPPDVEPTSSRLAVNDLEWLDLARPLNNMDDFDPWSKAVLGEARRIAVHAG